MAVSLNQAEMVGGVYASDTSILLLEGCTITGNRTGDGGDGLSDVGPGLGGSGGGVFCYSGVVKSCEISQNTTGSGGDAWWDGKRSGPGGDGGGICSMSSQLTIVDCFVGWNTTSGGAPKSWGPGGGGNGGEGGGLYCESSSIGLSNCIVEANFTGPEAMARTRIGASWESMGAGVMPDAVAAFAPCRALLKSAFAGSQAT